MVAFVGLAQSALVVTQAVLLATVIQRCLLSGRGVSAVAPELVGIGVALAIRGALGWWSEWMSHRTAASLAASLRRALLSRAFELGPSWLAGERAGELALTSSAGVDAVGVYFGRYLPQLVLAALVPIGVLAWVTATDWVSALILVALVALVPPSMIFFGRRAKEVTARQWRGLASLSAHLLELIQGLPTLRVFGRVDFGRREVEEATENLRRSTLRTLRVAFVSSLALELLAGLGTGLVAMVLGLRLLDGRISLSVALAVLLVSPEVFLPLRRAAAEFHNSAEGRAAGERIVSVLEVPAPTREMQLIPAPDLHSNDLRFESVTVDYAGSGRGLQSLSLHVRAGGRVALVGPSGCGKSTALHAILGFVPLAAGRILAGRLDVASLDPTDWRRHVAWVPQRPHLFSGTIADNILIADPEAGTDALLRVLEISGLTEVLERLPRGLDTVVGETGAALSAGERHRIAIARAALHGGELVLLDEIGTHLDPQARDRLRSSIEPWLAGRTVVLASHRPDIVDLLDDVVALGPPLAAGIAAGPS